MAGVKWQIAEPGHGNIVLSSSGNIGRPTFQGNSLGFIVSPRGRQTIKFAKILGLTQFSKTKKEILGTKKFCRNIFRKHCKILLGSQTFLLPLELILGKSTYLFGHNTFDKTRQEKKKGVSDRYIWWRPLSLTFTTDNYGVVGPLFQFSGLTSAELDVF